MDFIAFFRKLFSNQRGSMQTATKTRTATSTRVKVAVTVGMIGLVAAAAYGFAFAPGALTRKLNTNIVNIKPTSKIPFADLQKPTVSFLSPTVLGPATAISGVPFDLQFSYTDNVGVTSCTLYGFGAPVVMTLSGDPRNGTASVRHTATLPTGSVVRTQDYTVGSPVCVDAAGNLGELPDPTATSFRLYRFADNTNPTVSFVGPATAISGVPFDLQISYTDNVGVTTCFMHLGPHAGSDITLSGDPRNGTASVRRTDTAATDGERHTVLVTCYDAAGNIGAMPVTTNITVRIPTSP